MARNRSKSLVQSIALDLPDFNAKAVEEDQPPPRPRVVRSKSVNVPLTSKTQKDHDKSLYKLDPLTPEEYNSITNKYTSSFIQSMIPNYSDELLLHKDTTIENFLKMLSANSNHLSSFIMDNNDLLQRLNNIILKYDDIEAQTKEFNTKSLSLVDSQNSLTTKIDSINLVLRNFESLEEITKKLSLPNNSRLIKSIKFQEILQNLNNSLDFVEQNQSFKNIEIYKIKFRQCMTRCLTLIKDFLINQVKLMSKSVASKDPSLLEFTVYNEFEQYLDDDKFYNFPNLIQQITNRIELNGEKEYKGLFIEVTNSYFSVRLNHLLKYLEQNLIESNDLIKFTQDNLLFLQKILIREFKLFKRFFNIKNEIPSYVNEELYNNLKNLIDPFYDSFRQKILKETNISLLCQLTNLLQKYYEFETQDVTDINFGEIFDPFLLDVQSRLIFRIQIYVDNRLIPYKPKPEDLKIGNKKATNKNNILDEEFQDNLFEELYLPLGKALTILSNIYELINSVIFDDLAHYVVHSCIEVLKTGAYKLCLTHLGKVDAKLYYLKNLITLKYQLNNFDIQFVRTETSVDFTSGLNELYNSIRNGEILINLNNDGLFDIIKKTVPKIINNMIDAKLEIELEINNLINELLIDYLNLLIEPLNQDQNYLQNFNKFKSNLDEKLPNFKSQIIYYINDLNILKFLFNNLLSVLINYYDNYYNNLTNGSSKIDHNDLDQIMEPEIFINFINNLVDDLINDDSLSNNLMDIKPLLKFNDELNGDQADDTYQQSATIDNGNEDENQNQNQNQN